METKHKIILYVFFILALIVGMVLGYLMGYNSGSFELAKEKLTSEYYKTQYLQVCELSNKLSDTIGISKINCEDYLLK